MIAVAWTDKGNPITDTKEKRKWTKSSEWQYWQHSAGTVIDKENAKAAAKASTSDVAAAHNVTDDVNKAPHKPSHNHLSAEQPTTGSPIGDPVVGFL